MALLQKVTGVGFGICLLLGISLTAWRWTDQASPGETAVRRLRAVYTKGGENMIYSNTKYLADFQTGVPFGKCKDYCSNWETECPNLCTKHAEKKSGLLCGLKNEDAVEEPREGVHKSCSQDCVGFIFRHGDHCTLFAEGIELRKGGLGQYYSKGNGPAPTHIHLTLNLKSGKTIEVKVAKDATVSDVKQKAAASLEAGQVPGKILVGTTVLEDSQRVDAVGHGSWQLTLSHTPPPKPFDWTWVIILVIILMICCCLYSTRKAVYYGVRSATSQEQTVIDGYILELPAPLVYSQHPKEKIKARLLALDPVKKGWYCQKESATVAARSGNHTLDASMIAAELSKEGISQAAFLNFWRREHQKYEKRQIEDLMDAFLSSGRAEVKYIVEKHEEEQKIARDQYEAEGARVKAENDKALYYFAFGGNPNRTPVEKGSYRLIPPAPEQEEAYDEPKPYVAPDPEMSIQFQKATTEPEMTVYFAKTLEGERFPMVIKKSDLPLGISFHNELPIKLNKVEPGKWGGRNGVKVGWYLREVDVADGTEGKRVRDFTDFDSCKKYIFDEVGKLNKAPPVPERLTLVVKKSDLPIGIGFHNELPIKLNKVEAGHWAARNGVELGWNLMAIDGKEMSDFKDFGSAKQYISDEIAKLGK
jgi:hypothetical protein